MASKRANRRLIKLHRTYSVEEACDRLGVHKNTVRAWQAKGLKPIVASRPMLFQGAALRSFLVAQRAEAKRPCPPGMLYCFKCRAPRAPAVGMVEYVPRNARTGNLKALCDECDGMMHRAASLASLPAILPGIVVTVIDRAGTHKLAAPSPSKQ